MALPLRLTVLLAGAVASAIALAPVAGADPRPGGCDTASECSRAGGGAPNRAPNQLTTDYTSGNLPKGWTNEAQWARPGASNPFGLGPKPPVLAMD